MKSILPDVMIGPLAVVAQIFWLLQFALAIHVYRTGRPFWWIWILFMAPVLGGLAYLTLEILPGIRSPRGLWYALKPRKWRLADLRRELEECDTVKNRLNLAAELFQAGLPEEAHAAALECLSGVFKNDPHTMAAVAKYKLALAQHAEALALITRINTEGDRMLATELLLLRADSLAGLGRLAEAEHDYLAVIGKYVGEAPRIGLAAVYERTNRGGEAKKLWTDIRVRFRRASPAWRRTERKWYKQAGAKLKASAT